MNQIFEICKPEDPRHDTAIAETARWSLESDSMLTLNRQAIVEFSLSIFGFAEDDENLLLTHAGIRKVERGVATISGYVAHPKRRGEGFGSASLKNLVETAPAYIEGIHTYQAYVNDNGLSQFQALGGRIVGRRQPPVPTGCVHIVEFAPVRDAYQQVRQKLNLLH